MFHPNIIYVIFCVVIIILLCYLQEKFYPSGIKCKWCGKSGIFSEHSFKDLDKQTWYRCPHCNRDFMNGGFRYL